MMPCREEFAALMPEKICSYLEETGWERSPWSQSNVTSWSRGIPLKTVLVPMLRSEGAYPFWVGEAVRNIAEAEGRLAGEVYRDLTSSAAPSQTMQGDQITISDPTRGLIVRAIEAERARQMARWGSQRWRPDGDFSLILGEEIGEWARACLERDQAHAIKEMIQVAAVAVAWIEARARDGEALCSLREMAGIGTPKKEDEEA
jgi:hypothetical protein